MTSPWLSSGSACLPCLRARDELAAVLRPLFGIVGYLISPSRYRAASSFTRPRGLLEPAGSSVIHAASGRAGRAQRRQRRAICGTAVEPSTATPCETTFPEDASDSQSGEGPRKGGREGVAERAQHSRDSGSGTVEPRWVTNTSGPMMRGGGRTIP